MADMIQRIFVNFILKKRSLIVEIADLQTHNAMLFENIFVHIYEYIQLGNDCDDYDKIIAITYIAIRQLCNNGDRPRPTYPFAAPLLNRESNPSCSTDC